MLDRIKPTVARVEIGNERVSNGTAFLVGRTLAATARHVLGGRSEATLVFVDWDDPCRERRVVNCWTHPGYDLAILELESDCPAEVQPLPLVAISPEVGDRWMTFGFPSGVSDGFSLSGEGESISDPAYRVDVLEGRILQLRSTAAQDKLGGCSGAPCVVRGAIVGVITHQLCRSTEDRGPNLDDARGDNARKPALQTLYALPISWLRSYGPPLRFGDAFPVQRIQELRGERSSPEHALDHGAPTVVRRSSEWCAYDDLLVRSMAAFELRAEDRRLSSFYRQLRAFSERCIDTTVNIPAHLLECYVLLKAPPSVRGRNAHRFLRLLRYVDEPPEFSTAVRWLLARWFANRAALEVNRATEHLDVALRLLKDVKATPVPCPVLLPGFASEIEFTSSPAHELAFGIVPVPHRYIAAYATNIAGRLTPDKSRDARELLNLGLHHCGLARSNSYDQRSQRALNIRLSELGCAATFCRFGEPARGHLIAQLDELDTLIADAKGVRLKYTKADEWRAACNATIAALTPTGSGRDEALARVLQFSEDAASGYTVRPDCFLIDAIYGNANDDDPNWRDRWERSWRTPNLRR